MDKKNWLILFGIILVTGFVVAQAAAHVFVRPVWVQINDVEAFKVLVAPGSAAFKVDTTVGRVHSNTIFPLKPTDSLGDINHAFANVHGKQFYGQYIPLVTDTPYTCEAFCKTLETMDSKAGKMTCQGAIRYDRFITTCQDGVGLRNCICRNQ